MSYKAHIDKSEVSAMPTVAFEGRIITIDTPQAVDQAIMALSNEAYVGIDTETRPSFRKGVQHDVSLIQLSTPSSSCCPSSTSRHRCCPTRSASAMTTSRISFPRTATRSCE